MTRKDYVAIASALNTQVKRARSRPLTGFDVLDLVGEISDIMQRDNPNFDADRFMAAVTKEK